jgi:hypothetical protein
MLSMRTILINASARKENSPALQRWDFAGGRTSSPARDERAFVPAGLVWIIVPLHPAINGWAIFKDGFIGKRGGGIAFVVMPVMILPRMEPNVEMRL